MNLLSNKCPSPKQCLFHKMPEVSKQHSTSKELTWFDGSRAAEPPHKVERLLTSLSVKALADAKLTALECVFNANSMAKSTQEQG